MNKYFFIIVITFLPFEIFSQELITIQELFSLVKENSLEYLENKNDFISNYWDYKKTKLKQLPSLNFNFNPFSANRSFMERYDFENNIDIFRESSSISSNGGLSISQNIPFTGGSISIGSNISRIQNFGANKYTSYGITPIRINISQPIFSHNSYKWEKKELPVKLKLAKSKLLQSEQELFQKAAVLFFDVLKSSQQYKIAQQEIKNSDTLFIVGQKMLEIRKITPNELLELELKKTNAKIALSKAQQKLNEAKFKLNQLLQGNLTFNFIPSTPDSLPKLNMNYLNLLNTARISSPFYIQLEQKKIDLQKNLDKSEKQNKLKANLNFSFGLNQGGKTIKESLEKPQNQQSASLTLSIPGFDWGIKRGDLILIQKDMELTLLNLEKQISDYEQEILNRTIEYSINREIVSRAKVSKELASKTYKIKLKQYEIGEVTLQELNQYYLDLLNNHNNYIDGIINFWLNYYEIQKLTLCDLNHNKPLVTDFESLIDEFK